MRLNVVIPVYNEGEDLLPWLQQLMSYLAPTDTLVVVDASDEHIMDSLSSHAIFQQQSLFYLRSAKGRATQMNAGAEFLLSRAASDPKFKGQEPDLLWFLHSDSGLSGEHFNYLRALKSDTFWGRFDIELVPDLKVNSNVFPFAIISKLMNLRSRFTQVMTGDQGIYIRSDIFQQLEGYASISLMEDVEISKRLRKLGQADCDGPILKTSARRWQQQGWVKTVLLMWQLRLKYWFGVSPEKLVKKYYGK
ncbi:MAG: glycosyltransferase family 2 protein [Oleispira sp.]